MASPRRCHPAASVDLARGQDLSRTLPKTDAIAVALADGTRTRSGSVRAGSGLGHREGGDSFSPERRLHPLLDQLFGAEERDAVVAGCRAKMRPVLMTTLTTVLEMRKASTDWLDW